MTNIEFYAFCRDHRKSTESLAKRQALFDVYNFMRECGTTKAGVKLYIERMIRENGGRPYDVQAFQWLLSVFDGPSLKGKEIPEGQMQMF